MKKKTFDDWTARNRRLGFRWLVSLVVVATLCLVGLAAGRFYMRIQFSRECVSHLSYAAQSGMPDLSAVHLRKATDYLEGRHMTSGYTSVLYGTRDEDMGVWYSELRDDIDRLDALDMTYTSSTEARLHLTMYSVRSSLTDSYSQAYPVWVPIGAAYFPYNRLIVGLTILFLLMGGVSGYFLFQLGSSGSGEYNGVMGNVLAVCGAVLCLASIFFF